MSHDFQGKHALRSRTELLFSLENCASPLCVNRLLKPQRPHIAHTTPRVRARETVLSPFGVFFFCGFKRLAGFGVSVTYKEQNRFKSVKVNVIR